MKNVLIVAAAMSALIFSACNNSSSDKKTDAGRDTTGSNTQIGMPDTKSAASIQSVLEGYLQIKNALAADDGAEAANGGKALADAVENSMEPHSMPSKRRCTTMFQTISKKMQNASSENTNNIAHQREHFAMLSDEIYIVVKSFNLQEHLYRDYCEMYNNGKGAYWISETKEIKNPTLGKQMPTCGEVKEEYQACDCAAAEKLMSIMNHEHHHEHHVEKGHTAHHHEPENKASHDHAMHDKHAGHHTADFLKRFWICMIITVPLLLLSHMIQQWLHFDLSFRGDEYVLLVLSSVIYFYGGMPFLKGMISELRDKAPGMMTLVALAISVAFIYSTATIFGLNGMDFFWELATLIDIMLSVIGTKCVPKWQLRKPWNRWWLYCQMLYTLKEITLLLISICRI